MLRIAPLLALALLATSFAAAPPAAAMVCAPDEIAQIVCAVIGIGVNGVNFVCQKRFHQDCIVLG